MDKAAAANDSVATVAFEEFVATRLPALLRFGRLLTGNATSAEDLVQTALTKSYAAWGRIESADPEGYVRRTMANTHASWWRRPYRERPSEQLPERPAGSDPYVGVELREAVWDALSRLSGRQRAALVLRFYEDMSMVEIAETLGCRTGTAKSLISRGLAALRETTGLRDDPDEPDDAHDRGGRDEPDYGKSGTDEPDLGKHEGRRGDQR